MTFYYSLALNTNCRNEYNISIPYYFLFTEGKLDSRREVLERFTQTTV